MNRKKGVKTKKPSKPMKTQTLTDKLKEFDDEMERGIQSTVWLALTENNSERCMHFPSDS